ncbi:DUF6417 family protein [Streptomyces sp. NPDC029006]|uniref:DUF6417 family protein n=1 Tax=Streptomyces sp. NPDC029006 TaxID=3155467 RepID=UPI0033F7D432
MDGFEDMDLDEIEFAPVEGAGERLALLTLEEAHNLLDWLREVAAGNGPDASVAGRWAREVAARIPSRD